MHLCTNPEFNLLSKIHSFSPAFSRPALQLLCTPTKLEEMRFSFWHVPLACGTANRSRPLRDAEITNHYWDYEVVWCAYSRCFGCQDLCRLHASERYAQRRIVCRSTAHHRFLQTKRFGVRAALVSSHVSRASPDAEDLGRFYCCRGRTSSSHRWVSPACALLTLLFWHRSAMVPTTTTRSRLYSPAVRASTSGMSKGEGTLSTLTLH